ncbi:beta-L-arabinofuranosidase domain-containing protein [Streptomyces sp. 6N223]|uniref:beta-L-arabinofuranosidase domain-containing protein n=1 Tax=Streptomyces sp. 6N223 TaxID=3457412 RepID=UPI003FD61C1A
MRIRTMPLDAVRLRAGLFDERRQHNRAYLLSLTADNLLQNHYLEAGIWNRLWHLQPSSEDPESRGVGRHWGWESPGGQLRGHFVGHWLSAAAREVAVTGDPHLRACVADIVGGLARCQQANDGEWVFSIPPRYLDLLADGRTVWAPQYTIHKTLMGLVDAARDLDDPVALEVARKAGHWFARWAARFDRDQFDDILDVETGGMLEVWADLLELTGETVFHDLLDRYYRGRLFDRLVAGIDVLTNMHANTTIPEVLGAARAFEVTGESRWADVVQAYWSWAVDRRGTFCTGGQTAGEIWTPPFEFAARRGDKNQEHCVVYNMIRLADVLFRWTGEARYLDYIERNLFNGLLAQQHPRTGMVTYFLPLEAGARKRWGTPTEDFWCCHGTLVQAHTRHSSLVFYEDGETIVVAQLIPAELRVDRAGSPVRVRMESRETAARVGPDANAGQAGARHRPDSWGLALRIESEQDVELTLRVRIPSWVAGEAQIARDGEPLDTRPANGFVELRHAGGRTEFEITLPARLWTDPVPDEPGTVAFLHGPVVLAGLTDVESRLVGDVDEPATILSPDNERQWAQWLHGYRTVGQPASIRFRPLHEVIDEPYTVYFPVAAGDASGLRPGADTTDETVAGA